MADVLDFDPDRGLGFNPNRDLGFQPGRDLQFQSDRELAFDFRRDLGFGKKGVVFRGFVCPICGASVTEEQPTCTECGAVFDPKGSPPPPREPGRPATGPPPREAPARSPPPPPGRAYPMPPKRPETRHCTSCGARVASEDTFCWNCGNRAAGPGR